MTVIQFLRLLRWLLEVKIFLHRVTADDLRAVPVAVPSDQHQTAAGVPGRVTVSDCNGKIQPLPCIPGSLQTIS